jgi:chromosome segregation protein
MLKALELIGFKSFADKTRFEFPPGITAVVGPNGSGKSNIVDAIKWVLGEQSVKSLRGKEMADVIFNGSGSRHAVNTAEATLTFDNSGGQLGLDTAEVHITRRVYRSGEGEYLINRQPCRLRDIRDLFAGTGAATEAYSVIEQGKVDVLLQSSPRERRAIFEEAAGISRFKTKKLEATRRLERVDQNLLRLSDIVEEVDGRLRSVRNQATKARRYKEYTDRLQGLRTQVGLTDWRALSEQLDATESELSSLRDEVDRSTADAEAREAEALAHETEISNIDEALRQNEGRIAQNRESIAANESTIEHQRTRSNDLEEEIARLRRHLTAMSSRAGDLDQHAAETTAALDAAREEHARLSLQLAEDQQALDDASLQHERLREGNERRRTEQMDQMRRTAALGNRISGLESQIQAAAQVIEARTQQSEKLLAARNEVSAQWTALQTTLDQTIEAAQVAVAELDEGKLALSSARRQLASAEKELAQSTGEHTSAIGRAALLSELESRQEGLSAGVKEVLLRARESPDGPLRKVRGLVADLIHVSVETAPMVEAALGHFAQQIVVAGGEEVVAALEAESARLSGRVGFIRLDYQLQSTPADRVDLSSQPGVVGRADRFVDAEPEFVPLVRRLLGRTWIVDSLSRALELAAGPGRRVDLVTTAGELVTAAGTVMMGPPNAATGIISRRSELRALRGAIAELESRIALLTSQVDEWDQQVVAQDEEVQQLAAVQHATGAALAQQRSETQVAAQRVAELESQLATCQAEARAAEANRDTAAAEIATARESLTQLEAIVEELTAKLKSADVQLLELEKQRDQFNRNATRLRIAEATSQQKLAGLERQLEQLQHDQEERSRALTEGQAQLAQCIERLDAAQRDILQASSRVAEQYLQKEKLTAEAVAQRSQRESLRAERDAQREVASGLRAAARQLDGRIHAKDLAAGQIRHERATLAQRLREDYEIELSELEHEPTDEELHQREEVEQEIGELRRKINNIGNVNLEALEELEQLETRFDSLSAQFEDLSKAKASLEQIIGRINADSRRLFSETLEVVKGHFQLLFRKLFGGGQADIVLDDVEDVLESGIEIVARPPGKEPRSISLLSGGEKTLTCVALLMAIFKSRPSPFCVLDEVDAALDEANIERFVNVLDEFLKWTQFIIVTHSKKTMTCAGTLYGVTMQESGISKRVSVRFEDVSEDGHIHQRALERTEAAEAEESAGDEDETQAA